jgi:hypothetical protein
LLVVRVIVAAVSIGLPNFHHDVGNRYAVAVKDLPFDANALAFGRIRRHDIHRFARQADGVKRTDGL